MKKIIHVDMDCFFAAVEVRDNPGLKGLPVAVGGLSGNRGVICAANYEARKYGVRSALSSAIAMRQCPGLRLINPNMTKYSAESIKIHEIFRKFTDIIEPLSLDEAYLDVTNSPFFQGSASLIAREIRRQIFETTGLTASAGIAPNKFLAKVASDWHKPNGQFAVTPSMIDDFVKKLPVEKIFGVGKVTARKMHILGIATCGDLQLLTLAQLQKYFGSFGFTLHQLCRGIDRREVIISRDRKSVSIERTFSEDISSLDECLAAIPVLFERFQHRSRNYFSDLSQNSPEEIKTYQESANTLFVKIKFSDFTSTTIESSFDSIRQEHFGSLLRKGLERQNQRQNIKQNERRNVAVRLIGLGVRFKSIRSSKNQKYREIESRQLLLAF